MTLRDAEWEHQRDVQNDMIRKVLAALRAVPGEWNRRRRLKYVCGGCGKPLLEVMDTRPYPVVLTSSAVRHPDTPKLALPQSHGIEAGRELYRRHAALGPAMRAGERTFFPFSEDDLKPERTRGWIVQSICCRRWQGSMAQVAQDLRTGLTQRVIGVSEADTEGHDVD